MHSIKPTPKLLKLNGGLFRKYVLREDYTFTFMHGVNIAEFTIPKNFTYDGATLGSLVFWRKSIHETPYPLMHDFAYSQLGDIKAKLTNVPNQKTFSLTKERIDDLFLQGIRRDTNVQDWRALLASVAIKSIGLLIWQYRKAFKGKEKLGGTALNGQAQ